MMYEDDILRELWAVKEKIAAEYDRDPKAYWAKLNDLSKNWNNHDTKGKVFPPKSARRLKKLAHKKG